MVINTKSLSMSWRLCETAVKTFIRPVAKIIPALATTPKTNPKGIRMARSNNMPAMMRKNWKYHSMDINPFQAEEEPLRLF
jgi:hypothetical protein